MWGSRRWVKCRWMLCHASSRWIAFHCVRFRSDMCCLSVVDLAKAKHHQNRSFCSILGQGSGWTLDPSQHWTMQDLMLLLVLAAGMLLYSEAFSSKLILIPLSTLRSRANMTTMERSNSANGLPFWSQILLQGPVLLCLRLAIRRQWSLVDSTKVIWQMASSLIQLKRKWQKGYPLKFLHSHRACPVSTFLQKMALSQQSCKMLTLIWVWSRYWTRVIKSNHYRLFIILIFE